MVIDAPKAIEAIKSFFDFANSHNAVALVGHYVQLDSMVLKQELNRGKYQLKKPTSLDTLGKLR
jgi:DNA polymerase-3 subunit epsilon